ncbi:hypothetical protein CU029_2674 [Enterococcus faecium]|nr:hypothetical protein [Enterococcus faecium]
MNNYPVLQECIALFANSIYIFFDKKSVSFCQKFKPASWRLFRQE